MADLKAFENRVGRLKTCPKKPDNMTLLKIYCCTSRPPPVIGKQAPASPTWSAAQVGRLERAEGAGANDAVR